MEQILNCLLASLSDNQWQIKKALETDEVTLIFPTELMLTEQDIREIGRTGLKNKLLGIFIDCRKYNESLAHAIKVFETNIETFKAFGAQQFTGDLGTIQGIMKGFYRQFKIKLKEIYDFGIVVEEGVEEALVDTRFFVRKVDKPLFVSLNPYYSQRDLERWRIGDSKQLKEERVKVAAADDIRRKKTGA